MNLTEQLNDRQCEAVVTTEGPLLILAGAGSGKTRTIIHRIAYIIDRQLAWPSQILAITFTNKAAGEMRDRIRKMHIEESSRIWIYTFHAMCARILRMHGEWIGYQTNYVIYDTDDQKRLYKQIAKEIGLNDQQFSYALVHEEISRAKNELMTPKVYAKTFSGDFKREKIADYYRVYQEKLKHNNAMDFDDLIFNVLSLFNTQPDILALYQERFKYILVDEYQDTNHAQYLLVSMLAEKHHNICVCGDDDQSIYAWRGADISNILDFERSFPNAGVIKLEQNYRSTNVILGAANAVIAHNRDRKPKTLWTLNPGQEKVLITAYPQGYDEARDIAEKIMDLRQLGFQYGDCAVLFRTNAQSRLFEEAFMRIGIPYQLVGGTGFYSRMEIKDVMTYLSLINNPQDDLAFARIINVPKRGIGASTIEKIREFAQFKGWSMMETLAHYEEIPNITGSAMRKIGEFAQMMDTFCDMAKTSGIAELIATVIKKTGYQTMLEMGKVDNSESRLENLDELVSSAAEFEKNSDDQSLTAFLETVSLASETDHYDDENEGVVLLMTLHNAKGLEFPVVFLPGMEDGIFPHIRALTAMDDQQLEEERRICYVGITRAKNRLFMSWASERTIYGQRRPQIRSRFIKEVPDDLIDYDDKSVGKRTVDESGMDVRVSSPKDRISLSAISGRRAGIGKNGQKPRTNVGTKQYSESYQLGEKVQHKKFGIGTVVEVKPNQLSIAFPGLGIKKISPDFVSKMK